MGSERSKSVNSDFKERLTASIPVFNIIGLDAPCWPKRGVYLCSKPLDGSQSNIYRLTPREFQTLQCITEGMTNKEIARSLSIDTQTVKSYCTRLFIEFDCHAGKTLSSRLLLINKVIKEGILSLDPRVPEREWVGLKKALTAQAP